MKLHIFNDFSDNSPELSDFKAILKYSLHLYNSTEDLLISEKSDAPSYIEAIFEKCHSICFPLFHRSRPYYFFGASPYSYTDINSLETIYPDLGTNKNFWETAIKYQCILSTLITLIHFISKDIEIDSGYAIINKIKGNGYFSLLDEKILYWDTDTNKLIFSKYHQSTQSANYANESSNFNKTFKTFSSCLTDNEINTLGIKPENNFSLFNTDLLFLLYETGKKNVKCKKFNQFYKNNDKPFCADDYFDASKTLNTGLAKSTDSSNKADKLLLQYKLERCYNLSLNNCLIESIINFSQTINIINLLIPDSPILDSLLTIFNLPNVFSRNGFFKFALYSLNNDHLEQSTFYQRNNDAGPIHFVDNYTNNQNRLSTWLELFKNFTNFFSYIIFPIYERCFFIILKENLKYEYSENLDFVNISIALLKQYLIDNYDKILCYEAKDFKHQLPGTDQLGEDEHFKYAKEFFGNKEDSLSLNLKENISYEQNTLNSALKNILLKENSIIHPTPSFSFTTEYLNFIPGGKNHRKLMNLVVESILQK